MAICTFQAKHVKVHRGFAMAGNTITGQVLELPAKVAIHAIDLLVHTLEQETGSGMIKPGHAIQSIMADQTLPTEVRQVDCSKFWVMTGMAV